MKTGDIMWYAGISTIVLLNGTVVVATIAATGDDRPPDLFAYFAGVQLLGAALIIYNS